MIRMKRNLAVFGLCVMIAFAVPVMIFWQMQEADIRMTNTDIAIDCPFYGAVIQWEDMVKVEWHESLPVLLKRSNGFASGGVRVGRFQTESGETVRLYSYSATGPCICIFLKSGEKVYVNLKEKNRTEDLFVQIKGAH